MEKELVKLAYLKWKKHIINDSKYKLCFKKIVLFENNRNIDEIIDDLMQKIEIVLSLIKNGDNLNDINVAFIPKIKSEFDANLNKTNNKNSIVPFIDIPLEYYVIDTIYSILLVEKLFNTKREIVDNQLSYNNKIQFDSFFDENGNLNYGSKDFFEFYYPKYVEWYGKAKETAKKNKNNFTIIYVDFKSFYNTITPSYIPVGDVEYKQLLFNFEKKLNEQYLSVLKKYYKDICGCLPIGLISSNIISEEYMYEFDNTIQSYSPDYYGRYTDDILICFNGTYEEFTKKYNKVLEFNQEIIGIKIEKYENLIPNDKKTKHYDSSKLIFEYSILDDYIDNYRRIKVSNIDMLEFLSKNEFNYQEDDNIFKRINDYFILKKQAFQDNVFILEEIDKIINDIDCYINYYSKFNDIYDYLLLIQKNKKYEVVVSEYIEEIKRIIYSFDFKKYISKNPDSKTSFNEELYDEIDSNIKVNLLIVDEVNYKIATSTIDNENEYFNSFIFDLNYMEKSIIDLKDNFDLNTYHIYFDNLYFSSKYSCKRKETSFYNELFELYKKVNGISKFHYEIYTETINNMKVNFLNLNRSISNSQSLLDKNNYFNKYIGIANVDVNELDVYNFEKKISRLKEINGLIEITKNEMSDSDKSIYGMTIIFPELYSNPSDNRNIAILARKKHVSIVTGLRYEVSGKKIQNQIADFIFFDCCGFKECLPIIRTKNEYSPIELNRISALDYNVILGDNEYFVVNNSNFIYTIFYCYELTDIIVRSYFKGKINTLFVSEFNRDTKYFSNIIESTARDMSIYLVQSNVSTYGDSKIIMPSNSDRTNIISIKGGENRTVLVGKINPLLLDYFKLIQCIKYRVYTMNLTSKLKEFCLATIDEYIRKEARDFKPISGDVNSFEEYFKKTFYIDDLLSIYKSVLKNILFYKSVSSSDEDNILIQEIISNIDKNM